MLGKKRKEHTITNNIIRIDHVSNYNQYSNNGYEILKYIDKV